MRSIVLLGLMNKSTILMKKITYPLYFLLVFLLLDWGVGFFYHRVLADKSNLRIKSTRYHHDLRPQFFGIDNWGDFKQPYRTNSLGFRDRDTGTISLLTTSKKRFVFIGDSFTEGVGVSFDSSFVGRIASTWQSRNIEVLNAGVVTYSPRLYYLKMKEWIENQHLSFDHLVVVLDNADIQDEIVYENWTPGFWHYSTSLSVYEKAQIRFNKIITPSISWDQQDYYKERDKWLYEPALYHKWASLGFSLALQNIKKLQQLCLSNQRKLTLVIFPRPEQIRRGAISDSYVKAWTNFCKQEKIPLINLYGYFIETDPAQAARVIRSYFIPGDVHWNDQGHQLVSNALLNELTIN